MLDGVIDSHCDCNFFINIYHWDFPQIAALAAPRPLLIGGTDRDPLFHLDSTMRIYEKVRGIYQLYGATTNLALAIAPGAHGNAGTATGRAALVQPFSETRRTAGGNGGEKIFSAGRIESF